ncbi:MAG: hypothetical protein QXP32_09420 [Nitrososphaeria archaeon]
MEDKKMAMGILKKNFIIQTPIFKINIPKGTVVYFHSYTIIFKDFDIKLFKTEKKWYASIYGQIFIVLFDPQKPPYPISYFK